MAADRYADGTAVAADRHADGRPAPPRRTWQDTAITLVVALVAAAASYGHMLDVALMAGEPVWIARLFPVTVDGLVLAALRRGEHGRRGLALGVAVSIAANVLAQFPDVAATAGPVASAWPPLALYGTHRLSVRVRSVSRDVDRRRRALGVGRFCWGAVLVAGCGSGGEQGAPEDEPRAVARIGPGRGLGRRRHNARSSPP